MNNFIKGKSKARIGVLMFALLLFGAYVIYNLYTIQIVDYEIYQAKAIEQQTSDTVIKPRRGTIYDRNMKILAESATVYRVFIAPNEIETDEERRLISQGLSEILGVEYDFVYKKSKQVHRKDETIKKNVEKELSQKVRQFMDEHNIKSIHFAEETKRYYPSENLASHVLGFTGADNEGRLGVEFQYDTDLKGVEGKIIRATNAQGRATALDPYESYIEAKNGNNLVLTLDWGLQYILENNLDTALAESQAENRVTGIIMNVNNGEILAMATKPDFDLNNPYTLNDYYTNLLDEMTFETEDQKKQKETNLLYEMWKNKAITEPYEPGSTFKPVTVAMALEENAVKLTDRFYCSGSYSKAGFPKPIGCHLLSGHGNVTFAEGLQESCNPTMMQTAEKVGNSKFYQYFNAFGYTEKTGIDLPGEAGSIYHSEKDFRVTELAVYSFGQTFKVTPIQHITALAAVANGGKIVTPHIVKKIVDDDNNVIKSFDTVVKRQVISENTSNQVSQVLAEGVSNGRAARNAYVKGYNVAAKTGTSQKRDSEDETDRIGSCMGYAPADNPEIIVLFIVDEPTVGSVYGGVIAAPYISKILTESLPYLGFDPSYTEQEIAELSVTVMDYKGQQVSEAKAQIEERGLKVTIEGDGAVVRDQIPKVGSTLPKGGSVILYTDNIENQNLITVPDVMNLTAEKANKKIVNAGLNINIIGAEDMNSSAIAIRQSPEAGDKVPLGTVVEVEFRHYDGIH